jgi:hypothetical protein
MKSALIVVSLLLNTIMIGAITTSTARGDSPNGTQTAIAGTIAALQSTQTALAHHTPAGPIHTTSDAALRVFVVGEDGLLYQKQLIDGVWSEWQSLAVPSVGITSDSPSVVSLPDGRLDLFVRGNDRALWHKTFWPDGHASAWESLGGVLTSGPAAAGSDTLPR